MQSKTPTVFEAAELFTSLSTDPLWDEYYIRAFSQVQVGQDSTKV